MTLWYHLVGVYSYRCTVIYNILSIRSPKNINVVISSWEPSKVELSCMTYGENDHWHIYRNRQYESILITFNSRIDFHKSKHLVSVCGGRYMQCYIWASYDDWRHDDWRTYHRQAWLLWVVGEDKRRTDAQAVEWVVVEYVTNIVPNLVIKRVKLFNWQNIQGQFWVIPI